MSGTNPIQPAIEPNVAAPRAPARAAGSEFAALVQQRGGAATPGGLRERAWEAAPNAEFRQRIAEAERSAEHARSGYGLRNPASGALGRYQFLPSTLLDLGWRSADGRWTAAAQRQGVASEADFLARPAAQEAAMSAYLNRVEQQLSRSGAAGRQGEVLRGVGGGDVTVTEAGLVAAAHRRGAGTVARWLQHRIATPDAPLTAQQRNAYAQVERRLQEFAAIAYASQRAAPVGRAVVAAPPRNAATELAS